MDRATLMNELIMDEGYKAEVYLDHLGYPTFGVGHLILETDEEHGAEVGTHVSEERVKECLNQDIDIVCTELDKNLSWWSELDDVRQRVMANMCFNLGYPRFSKFKKFLTAMHKQDFETASVEMMDSRWATQVGARAERLQFKVLNGS